MGENSNIEWCHHTFNPWEGCTKVGPGCDHCYAETRNNRFGGGNWGAGAPRRRTSPANWKKPLKWNRDAAASGVRPRVFCASLADWLDKEVPFEWLADLLNLIRQTPHLDWLLLTKRIGNWDARLDGVHAHAYYGTDDGDAELFDWIDGWLNGKAPANVWVGATVVNQQESDRDIPKLLNVPAKVRWLSMEPLLSAVKLPYVDFHCDLCGGTGMLARWPKGTCHYCNGKGSIPAISTDPKFGTPKTPMRFIDWVVAGGESGPSARPMHPQWAQFLRDQCKAAGVPFLFKQWGEWVPATESEDRVAVTGEGNFRVRSWERLHGQLMANIGKKAAGRKLDDLIWDQYPERKNGTS
jgi:protein gp37